MSSRDERSRPHAAPRARRAKHTKNGLIREGRFAFARAAVCGSSLKTALRPSVVRMRQKHARPQKRFQSQHDLDQKFVAQEQAPPPPCPSQRAAGRLRNMRAMPVITVRTLAAAIRAGACMLPCHAPRCTLDIERVMHTRIIMHHPLPPLWREPLAHTRHGTNSHAPPLWLAGHPNPLLLAPSSPVVVAHQ